MPKPRRTVIAQELLSSVSGTARFGATPSVCNWKIFETSTNWLDYEIWCRITNFWIWDLTEKTAEEIFDWENMDRECNCNVRTLLPSGKCLYKGKCRVAMIVYKFRYKRTWICYYGKRKGIWRHRRRSILPTLGKSSNLDGPNMAMIGLVVADIRLPKLLQSTLHDYADIATISTQWQLAWKN